MGTCGRGACSKLIVHAIGQAFAPVHVHVRAHLHVHVHGHVHVHVHARVCAYMYFRSCSGVCEKNNGRTICRVLDFLQTGNLCQYRVPPQTPSSMLDRASNKAFSVCEKNNGFRFARPLLLLPTLKRGVQGGDPGNTKTNKCNLTVRCGLERGPTFFSQTPDRLTRIISPWTP